MAVFSLLGSAAGAAAGAGAAGAAAGATAGGASAIGSFGAAVGTAGSALSAIGTGLGIVGQFKQQAAAEKAEKVRENQMNLEASRQRRDIVRRAIVARSEALATGTAQGAQFGSGLAGGQAQITGNAAQGVLGVNLNQQLGQQMFAANREMSSAQTLSSIGAGFQGFGSHLNQNMETYGRLGTYYFG